MPQDAGPLSAHTPWGSALPSATAVHRPGELGRLQDWQEPRQSLSQQTPSAQTLEVHSLPLWHLSPGPLAPQLPFKHWLPLAQSSSV